MSRLTKLLDDSDATLFCMIFLNQYDEVLSQAACTIAGKGITDHENFLEGLIKLARGTECLDYKL